MDGQVTSRGLPADVVIREVGPRDGLQGEEPISPQDRARIFLRPAYRPRPSEPGVVGKLFPRPPPGMGHPSVHVSTH